MAMSKELFARMKAVEVARRKAAVAFIPCGFHCPKGKPFYCCTASICVARKKELDSERNHLVKTGLMTEVESKLIASYWDKETGFWSSTGCKLPRERMSLDCLEYVCGDN